MHEDSTKRGRERKEGRKRGGDERGRKRGQEDLKKYLDLGAKPF